LPKHEDINLGVESFSSFIRTGGSTMNTVTLPQSLIKRLEKISANSRHTPQSIIKQAITEKLDYEEWKLQQIDAGLADLAAGRVISHDEMIVKIERKIGPASGRKKTA
jgi:predicted transcriptional regulator